MARRRTKWAPMHPRESGGTPGSQGRAATIPRRGNSRQHGRTAWKFGVNVGYWGHAKSLPQPSRRLHQREQMAGRGGGCSHPGRRRRERRWVQTGCTPSGCHVRMPPRQDGSKKPTYETEVEGGSEEPLYAILFTELSGNLRMWCYSRFKKSAIHATPRHFGARHLCSPTARLRA